MKGTILDFLNLATEKPELANELLELAAKHEFEFFVEELSDDDLESVSGGVIAMTQMASQEPQFLALQQSIQMESRKFQTLSNASKARHDIAMNVINNTRA